MVLMAPLTMIPLLPCRSSLTGESGTIEYRTRKSERRPFSCVLASHLPSFHHHHDMNELPSVRVKEKHVPLPTHSMARQAAPIQRRARNLKAPSQNLSDEECRSFYL